MSIDESVQIHEWLGAQSDILFAGGNRVGTAFENSGIWMFLFGLPFLAIFLLWAYSIKQFFSEKPFIKSLQSKIILDTFLCLTIFFFSSGWGAKYSSLWLK